MILNSYRYRISLRLRHPSADPADFTAALGLSPFRCWRAGEARATPKGTPLDGQWPDTFWTSGRIAEGRWPGKALRSAIIDLLDQLAVHRDFFLPGPSRRRKRGILHWLVLRWQQRRHSRLRADGPTGRSQDRLVARYLPARRKLRPRANALPEGAAPTRYLRARGAPSSQGRRCPVGRAFTSLNQNKTLRHRSVGAHPSRFIIQARACILRIYMPCHA